MPRVRSRIEKPSEAGSGLGSQLITGSAEQEEVWHLLQEDQTHLVVDAVAGSGKTFTCVQACYRLPATLNIAFVAFNKHIAVELGQKLSSRTNAQCMTYHSLGFSAVKRAFGRVRVNQYRVFDILDKMALPVESKHVKPLQGKIKQLVGLAKQYCVGERHELEKIVDAHNLELNGWEELVLDFAPKVLEVCKRVTGEVDFDDMVWLPPVLELPMPKYDLMFIDEAQDTGRGQQWLALNSAERLVVVGDPRQAIYFFRGADSGSIDRLEVELGKTARGVQRVGLTYTRRCPVSHTRLAQKIVPHIKALPGAPAGLVRSESLETALGNIRAGDLVLCRVNAELLGTAYKLIKRGVPAVVRGRDIGQGLIRLIDKAEKEAGAGGLAQVLGAAQQITSSEVDKFMAMPNGRGEMRAQAAQDKLDCLLELGYEVKSTVELKNLINSLFADFDEGGQPKQKVVLGTVHRTKGLEGGRVYVLRPDLIPHPMARGPEEQQQELNLAYVAVTRSKYEAGAGGVSGGEYTGGELIFVGLGSALFDIDPPGVTRLDTDGGKGGDNA